MKKKIILFIVLLIINCGSHKSLRTLASNTDTDTAQTTGPIGNTPEGTATGNLSGASSIFDVIIGFSIADGDTNLSSGLSHRVNDIMIKILDTTNSDIPIPLNSVTVTGDGNFIAIIDGNADDIWESTSTDSVNTIYTISIDAGVNGTLTGLKFTPASIIGGYHTILTPQVSISYSVATNLVINWVPANSDDFSIESSVQSYTATNQTPDIGSYTALSTNLITNSGTDKIRITRRKKTSIIGVSVTSKLTVSYRAGGDFPITN